jgi:hypothetical protein
MDWTDPAFDQERRRHPEMTQYLLYLDTMMACLNEPAQTVREAERHQHLLKQCLRLLRRAMAAVGDTTLHAHLAKQLHALKHAHFCAIVRKDSLTQRAIERN